MQSFSLLCDLGNSAIKIGFAKAGQIFETCSLPAGAYTADNLGLALLDMTRFLGLERADCAICAAVSVAPALDVALRKAVTKYFGCETLFLGRDFVTPLENRYERPAEAGADRLAAAWGARKAFPDIPSLIVVDYGTAATFDCVENNAFLGGLIFPGPLVALGALVDKAAKLPHIDLGAAAGEFGPARSTGAGIRDGLLHGYATLTEGLCQRLARPMPEPRKFVATGGFAAVISKLCPIFDLVKPDLVLEGLADSMPEIKACQQKELK